MTEEEERHKRSIMLSKVKIECCISVGHTDSSLEALQQRDDIDRKLRQKKRNKK